MSVYEPPEIQEMVFFNLMYSSGKGSEFKMQNLESWSKINLKRVDRALDTLSQKKLSQRTGETVFGHRWIATFDRWYETDVSHEDNYLTFS